MAYLVRGRPFGTGSISSSPQTVNVAGFGNPRKSGSALKRRKFWTLGKKPRTVPPPETWISSAMANADVPPEIRQKLTGHASEDMNKQYTHLELETVRRAVDSISRLPR